MYAQTLDLHGKDPTPSLRSLPYSNLCHLVTLVWFGPSICQLHLVLSYTSISSSSVRYFVSTYLRHLYLPRVWWLVIKVLRLLLFVKKIGRVVLTEAGFEIREKSFFFFFSSPSLESRNVSINTIDHSSSISALSILNFRSLRSFSLLPLCYTPPLYLPFGLCFYILSYIKGFVWK